MPVHNASHVPSCRLLSREGLLQSMFHRDRLRRLLAANAEGALFQMAPLFEIMRNSLRVSPQLSVLELPSYSIAFTTKIEACAQLLRRGCY